MTYEHTDGRVLWITGLSGAGKTTLAKALLPHMGPRVVLLDGDELRTALNLADSGFDKESRKGLAFTYARLARMIALQRFTVVVATISLFHELHAWNRAHLPGYYEVWLDVPEEECRRRDPKRLYAASACGQLQDMACGNMVEMPQNPDLVLHFGHDSDLSVSVQAILTMLNTHKSRAC